MSQTDTHFYDTKLLQSYQTLKDIDIQTLVQPPNIMVSCNQCFVAAVKLCLEGKIRKEQLKQIKYVLNLFLDTRSRDNYDSENKIHVHDIFPRVWRFATKYDEPMLLLFYEQLIDVLGGRCSQGRTTRLIQFYYIHMNPEDNLYKLFKIS